MLNAGVSYIHDRMRNGYSRFKTRSFSHSQMSRRKDVVSRHLLSLMIVAGMASAIALLMMSRDPRYLLVALLAGTSAMFIDFVVEYAGIQRKRWDYPGACVGLMFRNVPLEVPLLFFFCGILATFVTFLFSGQTASTSVSYEMVAGLDPVQIILLIVASFFLIQYSLGKVKTLIFWALPLSIAIYISFPEPWLLAMSIMPIYLDYYLEKRLVRSSDITYAGYGDAVAINVAISYFPTTLLILGIVAVLLHTVVV
jgi:hypothetical protein